MRGGGRGIEEQNLREGIGGQSSIVFGGKQFVCPKQCTKFAQFAPVSMSPDLSDANVDTICPCPFTDEQ